MRNTALTAFLASTLIVIGCAPPEQVAVDTFLTAIRDGQDNVASAMSLASIDELDVESWEIVEIGEESKKRFELAELSKAAGAAREAHEARVAEGDDFLRANEEVAIRYQQKMKEDPEHRYSGGQMQEFQEAWDVELKARDELQKQAHEATEALEREREAVKMSTKVAAKSTYEGDVSTKTLKVNVTGSSGVKTHDITLSRYNLRDPETGISPSATWIVTDIT